MKRWEDARELAARMVDIGTAHGKRVQALITGMNQPLGNAVGNALEVMEAIETLKGRGPRDLHELCRELTAEMFLLGGVAASPEDARARFDRVLTSGQALEKLARVIAEQGGDPRALEDYARLPSAAYEDAIVASEEGYIAGLEAEAIGRASMLLGAGRERLDAAIDPAVGVVLEKKVSDPVSAGERICALYSNDRSRVRPALELIRAAIKISHDPIQAQPLIRGRVPE
jgi:thymidine phosphorylase